MAACAAFAGDGTGAFSVPLTATASGTYAVDGILGDGVRTELLVDTGSSYVVLSARTFAALKKSGSLTTFKRKIRGATASGRIVTARVYELSRLALGADCVLEAVEVVVLPGSDRDILGLSALKRVQPFTFDVAPMALRFGGCRQPPGAPGELLAELPGRPAPQSLAGAPW